MRGLYTHIALLLIPILACGLLLPIPLGASTGGMEIEEGGVDRPLCFLKGENRCRPDGSTSYQWGRDLVITSSAPPLLLSLHYHPPLVYGPFHIPPLPEEILKPPEMAPYLP